MLFRWVTFIVILKFTTIFSGVNGKLKQEKRYIDYVWQNIQPENAPINRPPGYSCVDSYKQRGTCIPIKMCPLLLNLKTNYSHEPAVRTFLLLSRCKKTVMGQPAVCCSLNKISLPLQQIISSAPSMQTLELGSRNMPSGYSCVDPENQPGKCIPIEMCPPLLELKTNYSYKAAVKNFLDQSQCKKTVMGQLEVCCSSKKIPISLQRIISSTPSTVILHPGPTNTTLGGNVKCGTRTITKTIMTRISQGRNANLGDWPWMAALMYYNAFKNESKFKCGGSLISNRWVLTAAHCTLNPINTDLLIRLGDLDLNKSINDYATPQEYKIEQIIWHPEFSFKPIKNDIALLRLKTSVKFTELIRPICILSDETYTSDEFYYNQSAFITGWGQRHLNGPLTTHLQAGQVPIVTIQDCAKKFKEIEASGIDHRVLCAGNGGTDTCVGDSGGPLMIQREGVYYVIGVTSYGWVDCSANYANYPGVYTRVAYFAKWIKIITRL